MFKSYRQVYRGFVTSKRRSQDSRARRLVVRQSAHSDKEGPNGAPCLEEINKLRPGPQNDRMEVTQLKMLN